jgi:hypothetical protein
LSKRTGKQLRRAGVDWHVVETFIRVGGKWRYLWRAVDATGQMVDVRLRSSGIAQMLRVARTSAMAASTGRTLAIQITSECLVWAVLAAFALASS